MSVVKPGVALGSVLISFSSPSIISHMAAKCVRFIFVAVVICFVFHLEESRATICVSSVFSLQFHFVVVVAVVVLVAVSSGVCVGWFIAVCAFVCVCVYVCVCVCVCVGSMAT